MAIQNIFVVGAGLMGSGIAQTAITSGYNVVLNDQRQEALERAKMGIENRLQHMVSKGTMSEEDLKACMARLTIDSRMTAAKDADVDVVSADADGDGAALLNAVVGSDGDGRRAFADAGDDAGLADGGD